MTNFLKNVNASIFFKPCSLKPFLIYALAEKYLELFNTFFLDYRLCHTFGSLVPIHIQQFDSQVTKIYVRLLFSGSYSSISFDLPPKLLNRSNLFKYSQDQSFQRKIHVMFHQFSCINLKVQLMLLNILICKHRPSPEPFCRVARAKRPLYCGQTLSHGYINFCLSKYHNLSSYDKLRSLLRVSVEKTEYKDFVAMIERLLQWFELPYCVLLF